MNAIVCGGLAGLGQSMSEWIVALMAFMRNLWTNLTDWRSFSGCVPDPTTDLSYPEQNMSDCSGRRFGYADPCLTRYRKTNEHRTVLCDGPMAFPSCSIGLGFWGVPNLQRLRSKGLTLRPSWQTVRPMCRSDSCFGRELSLRGKTGHAARPEESRMSEGCTVQWVCLCRWQCLFLTN